jgi:signal transduction histidine kinase
MEAQNSNVYQDRPMESNTSSSQGNPFDASSLLHELAAATEWQAFEDALRRASIRLLPSTRLDIYATRADGTVELRFTSDDTPSAHMGSLVAELRLRSWFEQQGYSVVVMLPLVAAGRQCGWLVLAQIHRMFLPLLRTVADQLAPLIAMRLQYELLYGDLINSIAQVATLERRINATDALRLRAILATGTAHDIGNIFTTVIGHAQLLQQDMPVDSQHDIGMIIRAAEDGRYLLRRLQSATPRFEASAEGMTFLPMVIDEAIQLTRPLWDRHEQIAIQIDVHDTPLVQALAADLREILMNLIINAVAAMPNGGTIAIGCHVIGAQAVVTVADTGHGIPLEYQKEIFQPFTTTREHGSGLGLSVSRAIVEGYGGMLTVASAPGQGATFTMTLPAVQHDRAVSEH